MLHRNQQIDSYRKAFAGRCNAGSIRGQEPLRRELAEDVATFLAGGNQVQTCPAFTQTAAGRLPVRLNDGSDE